MKFFLSFLSLLLCFCSSQARAAEEIPEKKRVLIGSSLRHDPKVLQHFFNSLEELEQTSYTTDFCFIDDNTSPDASAILKAFSERHTGQCRLLPPDIQLQNPHYIFDEHAIQKTWRLAAFKNTLIDIAKHYEYDYLFLADANLVFHPKTLEQLLSDHKDIVCTIFWTRWQPNTMEMPQVWLQDEYNFYEVTDTVHPSQEVAYKKMLTFFDHLKKPGVYEVGGLGACTLISQAALLKGVSFEKIRNVSFWGEDRHFCIRAQALGIPLFVDTHYPAYHIHDDDDIARLEICRKLKPRLTLSMIVKNEANKYLKEVLLAAREYITDAVIIDDASTDNTVEVCREILTGIPLKIVLNSESKFSKEYSLREQQWRETVATNPDWILCLDADEIFEKRFRDEVHKMIANHNIDSYCFRLYDLWDQDHYREDQYWGAHFSYRPFLIRYKPNMEYNFPQTVQHCGRLPMEILRYERIHLSDLRLKHYGWVDKKTREEKYARYQALDPESKHGWKEQYDSILDPNPNLITWEE